MAQKLHNYSIAQKLLQAFYVLFFSLYSNFSLKKWSSGEAERIFFNLVAINFILKPSFSVSFNICINIISLLYRKSNYIVYV